MAFNVEKDIFEPTQKSINNMNKIHVCSYCKTNVGFSNNKCTNCGAPSTKAVNEPINKQPKPRPAGPGRIIGCDSRRMPPPGNPPQLRLD